MRLPQAMLGIRITSKGLGQKHRPPSEQRQVFLFREGGLGRILQASRSYLLLFPR